MCGQVTDCMVWLNGIGLGSGSLTSTPSAHCEYVDCPSTYNAHVPGTTSAGGPTTDGKCPLGPSEGRVGPIGPMAPAAFFTRFGEYARLSYATGAGWTWWNFRWVVACWQLATRLFPRLSSSLLS